MHVKFIECPKGRKKAPKEPREAPQTNPSGLDAAPKTDVSFLRMMRVDDLCRRPASWHSAPLCGPLYKATRDDALAWVAAPLLGVLWHGLVRVVPAGQLVEGAVGALGASEGARCSEPLGSASRRKLCASFAEHPRPRREPEVVRAVEASPGVGRCHERSGPTPGRGALRRVLRQR